MPSMNLSPRARASRNSALIPTVLIVDPQPIVREALARRSVEGGLAVVAEAGTRLQAQELIAKYRPNLVILDLVLDLDDGLDLVAWIHINFEPTRVLVYSSRDPAVYGERALRAGALGYVGKLEPVTDLMQAIQSVCAGSVYTPRALSDRLAQGLRGRPRGSHNAFADLLTDRELQVFELLGSGRSTGQIASALDLSIKTIASHRSHIQRKLGITSFGELTRRAVLWVEEHRGRHSQSS